MDWNALNLTLRIEKGRAKPKMHFRVLSSRTNATQCEPMLQKRREMWSWLQLQGTWKGVSGGCDRRIWIYFDPKFELNPRWSDPLDCEAYIQKSQVLRLLVRSRSDQVRAMTNTMQSQYLANTFNLKVLYLNSPRSKWCMLFIGTWYICWPAWENSFYTPCNARQSIIPPWPLSCCCDMVTQ